VIACLAKNLSQSHDGVAQSRSSVELEAAPFAALYCSGPLQKPLTALADRETARR
jgi:hypothetical protein